MSTISVQQAPILVGSNLSRNCALEQPFCVGSWLTKPQLNRLQHRVSGHTKQLEPRLMHLLCYLAANTQTVLGREELVQELWPRVIVNENSLTRAISELRKQLKDAANPEQRFIETIPKKGYRLIPAVSNALPSLDSTRQISPVQISLLVGSINTPTKTAIVALCLSLALVSGFRLATQPEPSIENFGPSLIADEIVEPSDGFYGGEMSLSTTAALTANIHSIEQPVISHSGDRYAYIKHDHGGSTIYLGYLGEVNEPVAAYNCDNHIYNLSWSPLGNSLLFAQKPKLTTAALYSVQVNSGELIELNLDTYDSSRLIKDTAPNSEIATREPNLT